MRGMGGPGEAPGRTGGGVAVVSEGRAPSFERDSSPPSSPSLSQSTHAEEYIDSGIMTTGKRSGKDGSLH